MTVKHHLRSIGHTAILSHMRVPQKHVEGVLLTSPGSRHPFEPDPDRALLEEQRPLSRVTYADGSAGWLVTSHALAKEVLTDSRFSIRQQVNVAHDSSGRDAPSSPLAEHARPFEESFGLLDPPEHTRLRRLFAKRFSTKNVNEYRPSIERVVADCLDRMVQVGPPVDLVDTFTSPVAVLSQCAFLGVPAHDADRMQLFVTAFDPEIDLDEAVTAIVAFREFVEETIEQKRAQPADDLITDVVSSHDLTDSEILSVLFLLLGAGHNTTGSMLALGVFVLLARDDQLETACKDQPSLERTVEELLRYVTVFPRTHARTALADVELAGVLIKAGEKVSVSLSAANRDPAQFEAPGALNVARPGRSHLAFGQGVHMCLGQHLARLEMQVALSGLLQRFPTLRLAMPVEEIRMHTNCGEIMTRGVYELPVGW